LIKQEILNVETIKLRTGGVGEVENVFNQSMFLVKCMKTHLDTLDCWKEDYKINYNLDN